MADETIEDIMIGIRLVPDEESERESVDSLRAFQRSAMKILAPLGGAFTIGKMFSMTNDIIKAKDQAVLLGKQLKMNAGELYRMEKAGSRFGTSFTQNLLNIQDTFSGIGLEDKSALAQSLGKFGINIDPIWENKSDPKAIYDEISKQWQSLDINQKIGVKQTLQFDQGMMNLLENQQRYKQYYNDTDVPTEKELAEAKEAKEAMDKLGITMQNFMSEIATNLTPAITTLSEKISLIDTDKIANSINTLVNFTAKYIPDVEGGNDEFSASDYKTEIKNFTHSELIKERKSYDFSVSNPVSQNHTDAVAKQAIIDKRVEEKKVTWRGNNPPARDRKNTQTKGVFYGTDKDRLNVMAKDEFNESAQDRFYVPAKDGFNKTDKDRFNAPAKDELNTKYKDQPNMPFEYVFETAPSVKGLNNSPSMITNDNKNDNSNTTYVENFNNVNNITGVTGEEVADIVVEIIQTEFKDTQAGN